MRFASAPVSPCNMIGQRQTTEDDYLALTFVRDRLFVEGPQPAEHLRHLCIVESWLSHRIPLTVPLLVMTRLGLNLVNVVYPRRRPAETSGHR